MTTPDTIRRSVVEHISVLAKADAQLRYEREVPHVPVPIELIESFFDAYHPGDSTFEAAFSLEEKRCLLEVSRALESLSLSGVHSVADLLAMERWRAVMEHARDAAAVLAINA